MTFVPVSFVNGHPKGRARCAGWRAGRVDCMSSSDADQVRRKVSSPSGDAFSWGYPLSAVLLVVALLYFSYIGAFPLDLLLFFVTALVLIVFLLMGLVALFRERFKRAAALLLAPIVFIPVYVFNLGWMLIVPVDLVRFHLHRDEYAAVINALPPAERASRLVIFDWGSKGWAFAGTYYAVVYDESGEIELPELARTDAWIERARREKDSFIGDKDCRTHAYRLSGHFYKAVTGCPF